MNVNTRMPGRAYIKKKLIDNIFWSYLYTLKYYKTLNRQREKEYLYKIR